MFHNISYSADQCRYHGGQHWVPVAHDGVGQVHLRAGEGRGNVTGTRFYLFHLHT